MRHARSFAPTLLPAAVMVVLLGVNSTRAQQVFQFIDSNGPANSDWSNINNWAPQVVPNGNDSIVQIVNGDPVVDANYTVTQLVTNFGTPSSAVAGPGTLTIDANKTFTSAALLNRSGAPAGGTVLAFDGNVTIANSGGARTVMRTENFAGNSIRFGATSVLTLQTGLETQGGVGGALEFDGQILGPENLFFGINSSNSFGTTADNSLLDGSLVFFGNATTVSNITNGTLVKTGSKVQVNGNGSRIEVNGAETFFGSIELSASNNFTFDFDADQSGMDTIIVGDGVLTIDVDASVTELAFDDTSVEEWGAGSISIVGFKEDTIRFGTNATGLTSAQLAAIDGGIYSLNSQGYLTTMSAPSLFGDYNEDGKVDAADYTVWRDNQNGNQPLPNDNELGTPIGAAHYSLWAGNYGDSAPSATAIPEPGAMLLTVGALLVGCSVARRNSCRTPSETHTSGVGAAF